MIEFLYEYGLVFAFVIVMLEYACFPVPSELVLPWVGSMIVICNYSFIFVLFICSLAGLCGCLLCYLVGYLLSDKLNSKIGNKEWYLKTLNFFDKKHDLSLCFGRLVPLYRTYISLISGMKKHGILKFIIFSFIGICIWNFVLIFLGYYFYNNLDIVSNIYSKYKIICFSIIGIILIYVLFKKFIFKRLEKRKV